VLNKVKKILQIPLLTTVLDSGPHPGQIFADPDLRTYFANIFFPRSGAAEAVDLRGGDDPAVAIPGRAAQATQLQQEVERGAERVLLLAPVQPLPQRGGQGGARQEVRHHCLTGQFDSPQVTCFIHVSIVVEPEQQELYGNFCFSGTRNRNALWFRFRSRSRIWI
jgi:hypothetical protein